jgi:hypothetical protein
MVRQSVTPGRVVGQRCSSREKKLGDLRFRRLDNHRRDGTLRRSPGSPDDSDRHQDRTQLGLAVSGSWDAFPRPSVEEGRMDESAWKETATSGSLGGVTSLERTFSHPLEVGQGAQSTSRPIPGRLPGLSGSSNSMVEAQDCRLTGAFEPAVYPDLETGAYSSSNLEQKNPYPLVQPASAPVCQWPVSSKAPR